MAGVVSFMETPLVVWVQTFKAEPLVYKDLQDGNFLNTVMHKIDPRAVSDGVLNTVTDSKDRLKNWDVLMKNIKFYYEHVLQQFIVMKLPSTVCISRELQSDLAKEELQKVLLLILGCAVQCERKEEFIENIKMLDHLTQLGIVEFIKEITDDTKNVFAIDIPLDQLDDVSRSMHHHLRMLIQERDGYVEELKELNQSLDDVHQRHQQLQTLQADRGVQLQSSHGTSPDKQEKQQLSVELAELKARMRKLRQELEEKNEFNLELQEELEETRAETQKLRNENVELTQDARAARTYRDEMDILKEKASRVDKYEAEITKYKEKLNGLDFFKSRVDELREDNQLLVETRNELEEQLEISRKRIETVVELENEILKYKEHIQDLSVARDADRQKIAELTEQKMKLEFEKKSSFTESAHLEDELSRTRKQMNAGLSSSLSDQLNETANARLLRLELENQRLMKRVEDNKECQILENSSKFLELEKENHRLSKKVEQLQETQRCESHDLIQLETETQELRTETQELKQTKQQVEELLVTVKESSERHVKELERDNQQLQDTIQVLRERNEKTNDARLKDIEKENKRLTETVKTVTAQVSNLEYDKRQMQRSYERLEEKVEQVPELEEENQCLEKENEELRKNVTTLERTCERLDKLEQENSDMEVENQKLNKMVESLQKSVVNMESTEQENINLTVEIQHLKRNLETLKSSSSKVAELEHDKDIQNKEIQQLKKVIDSKKSEKQKQEQLEVDLLELDTDNQKLQRQLEGVSRKLQDTERENGDLEGQVEMYRKTVEDLKITVKKFSEVEKEHRDLEVENSRLHREHTNLEKENKRLKLGIESKEVLMDEMSSQVQSLEREKRSLKKLAERKEDNDSMVKELERENTQLLQQSGIHKKTLSTLREELVSEKIKLQEKSNELEQLTHELEKVGLNKEKLIAAEQDQDESKYAALETMMEDTFRNTMSLKEEKIHNLEGRLDDSKGRNVRLQEELQSVKREYAALQQRQEEEIMVLKQQSPREKDSKGSSMHSTKLIMHPGATKEILELKDHIITLERLNATLETEKSNLLSQKEDTQHQISQLHSQNNRSQSQMSSLQTQYNSLQSQCANLQVENKTLQSQSASLMSQNALLQKQHSDLEAQHYHVLNSQDELQSAHDSLQANHDALERLHEQLATEYEALISEHGSLKANHKSLRTELKHMQDENMMLQREKVTVAEVKESLEKDKYEMKNELERDMREMKVESRSHYTLQLDYVRIKEENMRLMNEKERAERDHRDLNAEYKNLKTEYNTLKSKHNDLKTTFDECSKQLTGMDMEVTKLANKCEGLAQLNNKLEEENRNLMMQLQKLLGQNQDMLTQALDSKDRLHGEQRAHLEQLSELTRQKEKLEEKIMEQYKRYDPVKKKNQGFGANLVKKAKALVGKKPDKRSKSVGGGDFNSSMQDSIGENSSMGSGSQDYQDSPQRNSNKKYRRGSEGSFLEDSPNLSGHSKALAKSTTALSYIKPDSNNDSSFNYIRGARSDENILDVSPQTRPSDSSPSSNQSAAYNSEWPSRQGTRKGVTDTSTSTQSQASVTSEPDDGDDGITLEEFLQECNKSPKSRRKWLVKNQVDLDLTKKNKKTGRVEKDPISQTLSPSLGARSPTVEKENKSFLSQRSKSEINISRLTTLSLSTTDRPVRDYKHAESFTSPRSHQSQFNMNTWTTSTPKYKREGSNLRDVDPQSQPQHHGGSAQAHGSYRGMNGDDPDHHHRSGHIPMRSLSVMNFPSSREDSDSERMATRQPGSGSAVVGAGSIGGYNATTRQTVGHSAFSPPQKTGSQLPPSTHSLPRGSSLTAVHGRDSSNDSCDRSISQNTNAGLNYQQVHRARTPSSKERGVPGPSPMKASYIPPDHEISKSGDNQYNPGNVRNLVQSFQQSVQNQQYQNQQHSPPSTNSYTQSTTPASSNPSSFQSPPPPQSSQYSQPSRHSPPHSSSPYPAYSHNSSPRGQHPPQHSSPHTTHRGSNLQSSQYPNQSNSSQYPNQSNSSQYPQSNSSQYPQSNSSQYPQSNSSQRPNQHQQPHSSPHPQHSSFKQAYQTTTLVSTQQDPVAPPRRTRPMSAGPLISSNSSAFSAPNRSHTPTHQPPPPPHVGEGGTDRLDRGMSLPPQMVNRSGTGRVLPQRPEDRLTTSQTPNRGPPPQGNPQQQPPPPPVGEEGRGGEPGQGDKPKNSKWYEYGCV